MVYLHYLIKYFTIFTGHSYLIKQTMCLIVDNNQISHNVDNKCGFITINFLSAITKSDAANQNAPSAYDAVLRCSNRLNTNLDSVQRLK
jgi:hypothetical protein